MPNPDIIEFITDPGLLGLNLSVAQDTLLRGIYGLPLPTEEHRDLWHRCTGRTTYSGTPFSEVTVIAGARAGKDSRIAAPIVVYEALFGGHAARVSKGEQAVIPLVAQDQRATKIAFGYIKDYLTCSRVLAPEVLEVRSSAISLRNGLTIECFPSTVRSLRGWSIPAAVMDELAFFRLDGAAESDVEIQVSIRRGMQSFPLPRLVKISTPYMKGGILFDDFKQAFGQDDPDLLVWRAPSLLMNPTLQKASMDRERRRDPARFIREYEAEFIDGLETFLPGSCVDAVTRCDRRELPPCPGASYIAAVDPNGAGQDAFTLAVVHTETVDSQRRVIHDVMRGWTGTRGRPVNLDSVVSDIGDILKTYRVKHVYGDRYASGWVRQSFESHGIRYEVAEEKAKAYLELEPLILQGRVELLDHPQLNRELKMLERRARAGGRPEIDHPRGAHDDYANALALAAAKAATKPSSGAVVESFTRTFTSPDSWKAVHTRSSQFWNRQNETYRDPRYEP